ncbi:MAG TPA: GNAT family protein [Casimicrobiaceae bacterium]|jgi:ribosomal-protein-alanine N-acetyltransferase
MPTRNSPPSATGSRVHLRPPRQSDEAAFLRAARASRALHGRWAKAPTTRSEYNAFVKRYGGNAPAHVGFLVFRNADGALCGVFNFSEIVRNAFNSAYLGYYAFAPHAGGGLMTEGFALVLDVAFGDLALHRVEVNVQPTNRRSLALVARLHFFCEGYSRRYVKIAGRWRDHVRFAMLAEDWRRLRRDVLARLKRPSADRKRGTAD